MLGFGGVGLSADRDEARRVRRDENEVGHGCLTENRKRDSGPRLPHAE
jgi:hypothetical protein